MSRSRKDKCGGHRKTDIDFKRAGVVVWGENGKRYAKRLRSKLARRHTRVSLRDLEIVEPVDAWEELKEFYAETYGDEYDLYDPYDHKEYDEPYDGYDPYYDHSYDYSF